MDPPAPEPQAYILGLPLEMQAEILGHVLHDSRPTNEYRVPAQGFANQTVLPQPTVSGSLDIRLTCAEFENVVSWMPKPFPSRIHIDLPDPMQPSSFGHLLSQIPSGDGRICIVLNVQTISGQLVDAILAGVSHLSPRFVHLAIEIVERRERRDVVDYYRQLITRLLNGIRSAQRWEEYAAVIAQHLPIEEHSEAMGYGCRPRRLMQLCQVENGGLLQPGDIFSPSFASLATAFADAVRSSRASAAFSRPRLDFLIQTNRPTPDTADYALGRTRLIAYLADRSARDGRSEANIAAVATGLSLANLADYFRSEPDIEVLWLMAGLPPPARPFSQPFRLAKAFIFLD